jgi:hypothetical protein
MLDRKLGSESKIDPETDRDIMEFKPCRDFVENSAVGRVCHSFVAKDAVFIMASVLSREIHMFATRRNIFKGMISAGV